MSKQETHVLTWSSNRGRSCFDDPQSGEDITSGEPISIEVMGSVWVDGQVEHASSSDGVGCYTIHDVGRPHPGTPAARLPRELITQERLQRAVSAAMAKGMSLADDLDAATGKVTGLFAWYSFLSVDGQILGLCTGMHVRSRTVFCAHAGE
jgi:hypothetical protein